MVTNSLASILLSGPSLFGQTEGQAFVDIQSAQNAGWMFNDEGQNATRDCADCATDLGWKPTNHAGGAAPGEGGGLLHRSGTLTIGDEEPVVRELTQEERDDGATFTAFGIHTGPLIGSADSRTMQIVIDDVAYSSLLSDLTPGDFNSDGSIDAVDFGILASNFNTVDRSFADGDADFNGVIDLQDFLVFRAIFAQTNLGQVATVPEPHGLLMSALGLIAMRMFLRRKSNARKATLTAGVAQL